MTKFTALHLLEAFANFDFQNRYSSHTDPFTGEAITVDEMDGSHDGSLWRYLLCEIYFKGVSKAERAHYDCGQERGDAMFMLKELAGSLDEFKSKIEDIATNMVTAAAGHEIETIFISDRLEDGDTEYFEWQRDLHSHVFVSFTGEGWKNSIASTPESSMEILFCHGAEGRALLNVRRDVRAEVDGTRLLAGVRIECREDAKLLFDDGDELPLIAIRLQPASGRPQFTHRA